GVAFADANRGIAVGIYGYVMTTSDGGLTWEQPSDDDRSRYFRTVQFFGERDGVVVGDGGGLGGVVYRSTDGGDSWRMTGRLEHNEVFTSAFVSPTEGVVRGEDGFDVRIQKTTDGGQSWHVTLDDARGIDQLVVAGGRTVLAVGSRWLRST